MNTFKVLQELAALKLNEKKSAPQLHRLQTEQLRAILSYAYGHSSYYQSAFDAAGLTTETVRTAPLSAFPVLDKATLLSQFDRLITVSDVTQEELRRFDAGEAQPLIRYHLSDRLALQPPKADSRYPFTRATGLLGRNEDLLWFEDPAGNREFLHPLAIRVNPSLLCILMRSLNMWPLFFCIRENH